MCLTLQHGLRHARLLAGLHLAHGPACPHALARLFNFGTIHLQSIQTALRPSRAVNDLDNSSILTTKITRPGLFVKQKILD